MLECLSFRSLTLTPPASASVPNLPPPPPHSQGNSTDAEATPATSTRSSPTPNVSREYDLAVQANSYNEIRSVIQAPPSDQLHRFEINDNEDAVAVAVAVEFEDEDEDSHHRQVLAQVLQPDRESVREALAKCHSHAPRSTLTRLVSDYFDHSETTCDLCLFLHRSLHRARSMYGPLFDLIAVVPDDSGSISQHHCDRAYDVFVQFDCQENPFVFRHTHNFGNMRQSFSELKQRIETRRRKCHSRIRLIRRGTAGCAICVIGSVVGTVVSTVLVATHAFAGFAMLAAVPFCNQCVPHPKKTERKELARLKQLDAAAKGIFVVNDLDNIHSLVDRLQTAVEGDKGLVRFALKTERERHPIQEVLKQLRKNQQSFLHQLEDLEEHIFLYFNTVNKARSLLLQECVLQTL